MRSRSLFLFLVILSSFPDTPVPISSNKYPSKINGGFHRGFSQEASVFYLAAYVMRCHDWSKFIRSTDLGTHEKLSTWVFTYPEYFPPPPQTIYNSPENELYLHLTEKGLTVIMNFVETRFYATLWNKLINSALARISLPFYFIFHLALIDIRFNSQICWYMKRCWVIKAVSII